MKKVVYVISSVKEGDNINYNPFKSYKEAKRIVKVLNKKEEKKNAERHPNGRVKAEHTTWYVSIRNM